MKRIFATLALLGFMLSLAVHVTALLGLDISEKVPLVWSLHAGIFVVFIPFALMSRKVFGPKPSFAQLREHFPLWVVVLGSVIFAYAIVNFLLFILATHGGNPSIQDGKFVLQSHGHLVRELTANEYASLKANELRGFSGHWLVFYFMPFAYFAFCKKSNPSVEATSCGKPQAAPHLKR